MTIDDTPTVHPCGPYGSDTRERLAERRLATAESTPNVVTLYGQPYEPTAADLDDFAKHTAVMDVLHYFRDQLSDATRWELLNAARTIAKPVPAVDDGGQRVMEFAE